MGSGQAGGAALGARKEQRRSAVGRPPAADAEWTERLHHLRLLREEVVREDGPDPAVSGGARRKRHLQRGGIREGPTERDPGVGRRHVEAEREARAGAHPDRVVGTARGEDGPQHRPQLLALEWVRHVLAPGAGEGPGERQRDEEPGDGPHRLRDGGRERARRRGEEERRRPEEEERDARRAVGVAARERGGREDHVPGEGERGHPARAASPERHRADEQREPERDGGRGRQRRRAEQAIGVARQRRSEAPGRRLDGGTEGGAGQDGGGPGGKEEEVPVERQGVAARRGVGKQEEAEPRACGERGGEPAAA